MDDRDQFVGNVEAPAVIPSVLKPLGQFLAGVVVHHVHVQFALVGKAGKGQIAAAQIADGRIDGIGAEEKVELGVQWVTHKQLDDDLLGLDLSGKPAQARFVVVGRHPQRQLVPELLRQSLLQPKGGWIVDAAVALDDAEGLPQFVLGKPLHTHQQSATVAGAAGPLLDVAVNGLPSPKVEIAYAEVASVGNLQRVAEGGQQGLRDVVEDSRHSCAYRYEAYWSVN